jgi:hypothetical protein
LWSFGELRVSAISSFLYRQHHALSDYVEWERARDWAHRFELAPDGVTAFRA